jgi:hypothetical protein
MASSSAAEQIRRREECLSHLRKTEAFQAEAEAIRRLFVVASKSCPSCQPISSNLF